MSKNVAAGDRGIAPRALLKRAAVVGSVAWTAPAILDSIASPAGALSAPCGCFRVVLDASCALAFQNNQDGTAARSGDRLG